MLALTDHDTVDGLGEAHGAARIHGITLVPGVEISVSWSGRTLHVVGLGIDPCSGLLAAGLSQLRTGRIARARLIGERLAHVGVRDAYAGATRYARDDSFVGRAHFAKHLVATGAAKDLQAAFRRFLGEGRPGYVKHQWAGLEDAVEWICAAGGAAVLAHPARYGLRPARLRDLLTQFRQLGGRGVEVVTASHSAEQTVQFAALAGMHGLHASLGSDFHEPDTSWMDVGKLPSLPAGCNSIWQDDAITVAGATH